MQPYFVAPLDVPAVWPRILPGVEELEAESSWTKEALYGAILGGDAQLVIFRKAKKYAGFLVFQQRDTILHMWALHAKLGLPASVQEYGDLLEKLGVTEIRFLSPRRGWERVAPKYGFHPVATMYRAVLNERTGRNSDHDDGNEQAA